MAARELALVAGLVVVAVACGCSSASELNRRLPVREMMLAKTPNAEYVVEPPDSIMVKFPDDPLLASIEQVRSDGIVPLPLVGEVQVAGLTTTEIRQKLEELYATYYKDPRVDVKVTAFRSKRIFLYGEFQRVGPQPYTGYMTVLDAVGTAGGLTGNAWKSRGKVVRAGLDEREVFNVNFGKLLLKGDARQDVQLAENDVLYVPPTPLAWLGYKIQSLLFPARSAAALIATPAAFSTAGGTSTGQ